MFGYQGAGRKDFSPGSLVPEVQRGRRPFLVQFAVASIQLQFILINLPNWGMLTLGLLKTTYLLTLSVGFILYYSSYPFLHLLIDIPIVRSS